METKRSVARTLSVRFAAFAIGLALIVASAFYVRWIIGVDAFAKYRAQAENAFSGVAIRVEDAEMRSYYDGKLVGECRVGRLDIKRNRNEMDFFDISDGVYHGEKGDVRFSGKHADYNAGTRLLRSPIGGRIWNDDMDVNVDGFVFDEKHHDLRVPGKVTGKLFDGNVQTEKLEYSTEDGSYTTGPIVWEGELRAVLSSEQEKEGSAPPKQQPQAEEGKRVLWKIKALGSSKKKGDIETYNDAEATDGEVIVKAPVVEMNRKTDELHATGRVLYFGEDANVACDEVTIYRKEKRAVLSGDVTMLVKPKDEKKLEVVEIPPFRPTVPEEIAKSRPPAPDVSDEERKKQGEEVRSTQNLRKFPVSLHADKIVYWYAKGNRHAEITGSPEAYQALPSGWRRAWAPKAFYDGEKETLRLVSTEGKKDTRVRTSIGDVLVATWFQLSTKDNGEDEWEGAGIEGDVYVDEEEPRTKKQETGKPPPSNSPLKGDIGLARRPRN
jgi:lipopolysaccharide export system protein LptA